MLKINDDYQVIKHNKLVEAKSKLNLTEQKLFLSLVSMISTNDKDFKKYHIEIKDFLNNVDSKKNGKTYKEVLKSAERLKSRVVKLEDVNPKTNKKRFNLVGLVSSIKYEDGQGVISIEIHKDLKPYLLNLKGSFTKYALKNILKLNSNYSIRIYELCKQKQGMTPQPIEIQELRELLGISNEKYKRFTDFERRILKHSAEEINKKTDINISYKKIKRGRSITHIEFSIQSSNVDEKAEVLEKLYDKDEYDQLVSNMNLTDKKLNRKQIFELYEIACDKTDHINNLNVYDYVKINVDYTNKQKPKNYVAYLKKALQNDFSGAITILKLLGNKE